MPTPIESAVDWHFWLDVADKVLKALAVIVGGWWTWRIYRLDSTHKYRLQAEVKAEFAKRHDREFIVVNCQLKNGCRIRNDAGEAIGTGLLFGMIRAEETAPHLSHREPLDSDLTAFEIFKAHDEIGPGLTISEQILVPKPPGSYDACWVQLRVVTRQPRYPPQQWSAIAIAVKE